MSDQPSKSVCQCACCGNHFPFILAAFDGDLNGPVCANCFKLLKEAKLQLTKQGIKTCTNHK